MNKFFLGIDIGSSSVKTVIFDAQEGKTVARATWPTTEQPINAPRPGWAEQDPQMWWDNFKMGYAQVVQEAALDTSQIVAIGISYQMHGLVALDSSGEVVRPSIIWCDSRAVDVGQKALESIGLEKCLEHFLNSPGNFTAAKLGWVRQNEPDVFERIYRFMLPGDYIAYRLTGEMTTTEGGLSEGVLWDFTEKRPAVEVMAEMGISPSLLPDRVPSVGFQGVVSPTIAEALGLSADVRVTYRAGDQPNNAFSLGVLEPGQIATSAGTSAVIYAVTDKNAADKASRVNTFLHVNNQPDRARNGVLVCVNGSGILYSWLRRLLGSAGAAMSYQAMNALSDTASPGSEGLLFYPFGNGAERILNNARPNASIQQLDFNRHGPEHLIRAGMEGIVYAMNLGIDVLRGIGVTCESVRAGRANLFLSPAFRSIFANVTNMRVHLFDTDGAEGAARGAALGAGYYADTDEAFNSLHCLEVVEPNPELVDIYDELFAAWSASFTSS
ncbi:MAG: FGGY family carbohydrate kinase [Bacteroidetes bacterium]|nr:FGGY family carbohydrate kinase [Bacteroidota bacterium]